MPVGFIGAAAFFIDDNGTDPADGSENGTGTSHNAKNTSFAGGNPGILKLFSSCGRPEESGLLHLGRKKFKKRGSQCLFREKGKKGITFFQQFRKFFPPGGGFAFIKEILFVLSGNLRVPPGEGVEIIKGAGKGENGGRHGNFQYLSGAAGKYSRSI